MTNASLKARANRHAALGDPVRLAIIEELARSDRAPVNLRQQFALESNLLAHHLDVLEEVGLIRRVRSRSDGRRRYVQLQGDAFATVSTRPQMAASRALFICEQNSARSQIAASLWREITGADALSAGTNPASCVHPGAVAAALRAGLDLGDSKPRHVSSVKRTPPLVITVCDHAYESFDDPLNYLHWSTPDPTERGTKAAFDATVRDLRQRIIDVAGAAA